MQRMLYLFLSFFIFFVAGPPALAGTATAFSDQFADLKSHPWGAGELAQMVQFTIYIKRPGTGRYMPWTWPGPPGAKKDNRHNSAYKIAK